MNIRVYKPNHFFDLMEDKKYAIAYLSSKDPHEFTKKRLLELIEDHKTAEKKYNINKLYLLAAQLLKNNKLLYKILNKNQSLIRAVQSCDNKIKIFESNLAALILLEIIDINKAEGLGHSEEYLTFLLGKYKTNTEREYDGYFYDEISGRAGKVTPSGLHIVLPYTPRAVICELNRKRNNNIGRYVR